MRINEKGEGKGGAIFGFAVFALVVYIGITIIPVMIRVYAFEDAVREDVKFLRGRSLETLEKELIVLAQQKDLPVTEESINMVRVKDENHYNLRVDIVYSVPIATPFFVYDWDQVIAYDAPVFE